MYMDAHAHYFMGQLDKVYRKELEEAMAKGIVAIVNSATTMESNQKMREKLGEFPNVFFTHGRTWSDLGDADEAKLDDYNEHRIREWLKLPKTVGVGEFGLDSSRGVENLQRQKEWVARQLKIARDENLPSILHCRGEGMHQELLKLLETDKALEQAGLLHCFNGSPELAGQYINKNFLLGIGGMVTNPANKELRETVKKIPLEYLLLETDTPYLAPYKKTGGIFGGTHRFNSSLNLPKIAEEIAALKKISPEEVEQKTFENGMRLFPFHIR